MGGSPVSGRRENESSHVSSFDVLVVGAGHAGCEAAHAAAGMGSSTALLSGDLAAMGRMSCNPAIGGLAKGSSCGRWTPSRLDGALADRAGIQFKILNRSRGPAVWDRAPSATRRSTRASRGKRSGRRRTCGSSKGWRTTFSSRAAASRDRDRFGERIRASAVVVTTGTFLRGLITRAKRRRRAVASASPRGGGLSSALARLGLRLGRFKTGTPPRVRRDTVDSTGASLSTATILRCLLLPHREPSRPAGALLAHRTNERVHELVRANLHRSPMYSGRIVGIGPRYCPSLEDKVVKFADKPRHSSSWSPRVGTRRRSTSTASRLRCPRKCSARSSGWFGARRRRDDPPGYAVEYDFSHPDQLRLSLEVRDVPGLSSRGRSTERRVTRRPPRRESGPHQRGAVRARRGAVSSSNVPRRYAAVMVDDLTSKGIEEPIASQFTREYRLLLGVDSVLPASCRTRGGSASFRTRTTPARCARGSLAARGRRPRRRPHPAGPRDPRRGSRLAGVQIAEALIYVIY